MKKGEKNHFTKCGALSKFFYHNLIIFKIKKNKWKKKFY